jgi:caffeoyl-CoA O-methyltransferase
MPDKYTVLSPELYAYAVEHGARQDDVLRRLAEETKRELEDVAIMQIGADQGAFMTLVLRLMGARRALAACRTTACS